MAKENGHGVEPLANRLRMVEPHAKVYKRLQQFVIKDNVVSFQDCTSFINDSQMSLGVCGQVYAKLEWA